MRRIVEVEGELYINLGVTRNGEDMGSTSYDRDYALYPYTPDMEDEIHIDPKRASKFTLRGTKELIKERPDKIPYAQFGYSKIRGKEIIMLERVYPEPVVIPGK